MCERKNQWATNRKKIPFKTFIVCSPFVKVKSICQITFAFFPCILISKSDEFCVLIIHQELHAHWRYVLYSPIWHRFNKTYTCTWIRLCQNASISCIRKRHGPILWYPIMMGFFENGNATCTPNPQRLVYLLWCLFYQS